MDIIQLAELEAKQIQQQAQQECKLRRSRLGLKLSRCAAQQELQEMQLHAIAEFEAIQKGAMNTPMTSSQIWSSNSTVCYELSATAATTATRNLPNRNFCFS